MGFFDALFGRSQPKTANLDALFQVPSAAITLTTQLGFDPTGRGAVCYRSAVGAGFAETQSDIVTLLTASPEAPQIKVSDDEFGFTWLEVSRHADIGAEVDTAALCTDLHAVNTSLEAQGYSPALLCSVIPFADSTGRVFGLVYLYKQGTFYPFAPTTAGARARDNLLEIQLADAMAADLPVEQDKSRWLAIWGAPGL